MEDKRIKKHFKKLVRESIDELGLVTKKDLQKLKAEIRGEKMPEDKHDKKHEQKQEAALATESK